ncbi:MULTISPECIES: hypothetical protein [Moorena]|uniref:Uncharacterized protein n=1 Tax=Moorena producens 3L TaxID=489825 RepID=F4XTK3_9CYAN|nr:MULTISPECIES: hypothetical protein [Moorena]NEQ13428.1 hypothetical protein [Moorena sp. SIO3E2]EGJ32139.1 hypothetical protein LYNGBM3L_29650 [Moorena producens 3L]NEP64675.1 hypothetical protein [Moorena sp. SIO3A5]NEQ07361.1 hypothetical protein [Moorena sp. SIO4E2]NER85854.1 hypothetical protein [Moorena sp. SIO3A2]
MNRIDQELAALEEAITHLAKEFQTTYSNYLTFLGQCVGQQLIMAAYRICTQGYPESFLNLSVNSRQQLQQSLRKLAQETQQQLPSLLEQWQESRSATTDGSDHDSDHDSEMPSSEIPSSTEDSPFLNAPTEPSPAAELTSNPRNSIEKLEEWLKHLESGITKTIQDVSVETNRILHKSSIIPDKFPQEILEAAAKVEASAIETAESPNIIKIMMETKGDGETDESRLTRIIAIKLRLSEIEFADPNLTPGRKKIRDLLAKMSQLKREYYKKQRQKAVAQAEAAWRASWFDD